MQNTAFEQYLLNTDKRTAYEARVAELQELGLSQAMAEGRAKFEFAPPPPANTKSNSSTSPPELQLVDRAVFEGKPGQDEISDLRWTGDNLAVANVSEHDAPSARAWALLQWARENQSEFWKQLFAKTLPTKKELTDEKPPMSGAHALATIKQVQEIAARVRVENDEARAEFIKARKSDLAKVKRAAAMLETEIATGQPSNGWTRLNGDKA